MRQPPAERARLHALLGCAHTHLVRRGRHVPLGWSEPIHFSRADLGCARDLLDRCVDGAARGRAHLPPEAVPWDALRTTLAECAYGGRISRDVDRRRMAALIGELFVPVAFERGFAPFAGGAPPLPDGASADALIEWARELPDGSDAEAAWLGLPTEADDRRERREGDEILATAAMLARAADADANTGAAAAAATAATAAGASLAAARTPARLRALGATLLELCAALPAADSLAEGAEDAAECGEGGDAREDAGLAFALRREVAVGARALRELRAEIADLACACERGDASDAGGVLGPLLAGRPPARWCVVPATGATDDLRAWAASVGRRVSTLREAAASPSTVLRAGLHLGRLTQPLALLAALQHEAARACAAPIEEMRLTLLGAEAADHAAGPAERPERALPVLGLSFHGGIGLNAAGVLTRTPPDAADARVAVCFAPEDRPALASGLGWRSLTIYHGAAGVELAAARVAAPDALSDAELLRRGAHCVLIV